MQYYYNGKLFNTMHECLEYEINVNKIKESQYEELKEAYQLTIKKINGYLNNYPETNVNELINSFLEIGE
jgi:excinuclease UvrABC nuclease subunit